MRRICLDSGKRNVGGAGNVSLKKASDLIARVEDEPLSAASDSRLGFFRRAMHDRWTAVHVNPFFFFPRFVGAVEYRWRHRDSARTESATSCPAADVLGATIIQFCDFSVSVGWKFCPRLPNIRFSEPMMCSSAQKRCRMRISTILVLLSACFSRTISWSFWREAVWKSVAMFDRPALFGSSLR